MSQNPDTKDYIIVLQQDYQDRFCKKCFKEYTDENYKWCKPCLINDLKTNLTSDNEKINGFIQEMQLKINSWKDIVFEWIPYNQFIDFKEVGRSDFTTVYSAIWKDGPFIYDGNIKK